MVKREILTTLLDQKKAAVLRIILHSSEELYLKEIAQKAKVSITSTFRILQELVTLEIVSKREWKTSKVYRVLDNKKTEFLKELFHEEYDGTQEFVEAMKGIAGIQSIILHGGRKKGKANLLLLGEGVDNSKIEEACLQIRQKGFDLSYLTLSKAQYEQMAKMGLYSGEKLVLL